MILPIGVSRSFMYLRALSLASWLRALVLSKAGLINPERTYRDIILIKFTSLLNVMWPWPTAWGLPMLRLVVAEKGYLSPFPELISFWISSPLRGIFPLTAYSAFLTLSDNVSFCRTLMYVLVAIWVFLIWLRL
jgi:hypothetical protein